MYFHDVLEVSTTYLYDIVIVSTMWVYNMLLVPTMYFHDVLENLHDVCVRHGIITHDVVPRHGFFIELDFHDTLPRHARMSWMHVVEVKFNVIFCAPRHP